MSTFVTRRKRAFEVYAKIIHDHATQLSVVNGTLACLADLFPNFDVHFPEDFLLVDLKGRSLSMKELAKWSRENLPVCDSYLDRQTSAIADQLVEAVSLAPIFLPKSSH
jgi:hypothetical protein